MVYPLTNHEYPHVPHPEELFEEGGEGEPHGDGGYLKQLQLCGVLLQCECDTTVVISSCALTRHSIAHTPPADWFLLCLHTPAALFILFILL